MRLGARLHFLHRAWRYRLRTERDELAFVLSRDLRGATVLDIGANRGIYSYWMHRAVGTTGLVVAFEPQPEIGAELEDLKKTLSLDRLTVVNAGLSSVRGEMTLVRPRNHWAAASFHLSSELADTDSLKIPVLTLDEYFDSVGQPIAPIRLIKCDVENHEEDVFLGGERLLRQYLPDLVFEQHDDCWKTGRLSSFLEGLGYAGSFFYQHQLVPTDRLAEIRSRIPKPYLNYVFTAQAANVAVRGRRGF